VHDLLALRLVSGAHRHEADGLPLARLVDNRVGARAYRLVDLVPIHGARWPTRVLRQHDAPRCSRAVWARASTAWEENSGRESLLSVLLYQHVVQAASALRAAHGRDCKHRRKVVQEHLPLGPPGCCWTPQNRRFDSSQPAVGAWAAQWLVPAEWRRQEPGESGPGGASSTALAARLSMLRHAKKHIASRAPACT
jgi:hypothetical protein